MRDTTLSSLSTTCLMRQCNNDATLWRHGDPLLTSLESCLAVCCRVCCRHAPLLRRGRACCCCYCCCCCCCFWTSSSRAPTHPESSHRECQDDDASSRETSGGSSCYHTRPPGNPVPGWFPQGSAAGFKPSQSCSRVMRERAVLENGRSSRHRTE